MPLLLALLVFVAPQPAGAGVAALTFSAPTAAAQLDTGKLDGAITRLAWSPDGSQIYLEASKADRFGNVQNRHYVLTLGDKAPERAKAAPPWAASYWLWKSSPTSPGSADFHISVESQQKTFQGVATPTGGDLARGGGDSGGMGTSVSDFAAAARTRQNANDIQLRAAGHLIGEWINEPVQPGLTFGWAPASIGVLSFVDRDHDGRLTVLDAAGHVQTIEATEDALLPAWSSDGTKLAFLKRDGKKRYVLEVIDVESK
jgi:hypothetical protein